MTRRQGRKRPPLLRFRETTKYHGDVRAVGPISLDVSAGQLVALLGHNGSGKSTLLATASGVLEPTDGTVAIAGSPAGNQAARAAVSYIGDSPILYDDLSLNEHLEYLSRLHGSTPAAHDAPKLIDRLGLRDHAESLPSTFSRGLRQKAAIAIAFCRPFALLLIDEPFAGLDRAGRGAFVELIRGARDQNGTVVVATHDHAVLDVFDRAVLLNDGTVVYDGTPGGIPPDHRPHEP